MRGHCDIIKCRYNIHVFICNMGGMANSADPDQVWVCTVCAYTQSALICGAMREIEHGLFAYTER